MSEFLLASPLLRVLDMDEALAFYVDLLGFRVLSENRPEKDNREPAYVVIARDKAGLYLSSFMSDGVTGSIAVIFVSDLDELAATLKNQDIDLGEGIMDQTWGNRELYVKDPHGNRLRFTQLPE